MLLLVVFVEGVGNADSLKSGSDISKETNWGLLLLFLLRER